MSEEFETAPWSEIETKYQTAIEQGQPRALLEFITLCALHQKEAPFWAAKELIQRWSAYKTGKSETLGRAFNCPDHKSTDQRKMVLGGKAFNRLCYLIHAENRPVDQNLFDEVGEEFEMSGSWVRDRYYEIMKDDDGLWHLGTGKI